MNSISKEINKLKNLKQNKNKSLANIEKQAKINVWKKQVDIKKRFHDRNEKKFASDIFENYLTNYDFNNFSDVNTLADLVYEEVLKKRLQDTMNNIVKKDNNTFISDKMVRNLHQTEDRVLELKDKLGISTDDKQEEDLTALQQLKKRFSTYINFNRNEFTTTCNYCGQMLLLRRRVKDFEALKHPAFSGRFLYNPEIIDDVKAGKITKEQASRYLRTSPDYITWCIENEQKIIEVENVAKENIDNFVNNNPNLRNAEDYKEK